MKSTTETMTGAMIISLGGTPEPLVRAIGEHRPRFICFLASQQSIFLLGRVQDLLKEEGLPVPETHVVLAGNVDDLVHCYEKALECARVLEDRRIPADQVVVDYTGGTKNMTAALTLATVGKGYRFSYVGGESRNKEGLGTVVSGTEVVHTGVSPWQIFAVEEWQHLVIYVAQHQYGAALTLVRETRQRLPRSEQPRWQGLEHALEGLLHWDCFRHKEAYPMFQRGLLELEHWVQARDDQVIAAFVEQAQPCLIFLQALAEESRGFKQPCRLLLVDLLANAERRAVLGRYDDAVARLYRALEMQGQIAFREKTGASTSEVPEDIIPEGLRQEYLSRYQDPPSGKIKIPLMATFRLLRALGHPVGEKFSAQEEVFLKILSARNQSILAHGTQPVDYSTFASFRDLLRQSFALEEMVTFPKLRSPF